MENAALLVIAKQPVPGRVKTRLTPPCSPHQAAALAEAALRDTLAAVAAAPAARRVLVFDGDPEPWRPPGFETLLQRGDGLGERLAAAFDDIGGPALLVGMDTPQLTPGQLADALAALHAPGCDAVLGPTPDGGYWCVGFDAPVAGAFSGVPMSRADTYRHQQARLRALGLRVGVQPPLRDVDTIEDARAVAGEVPRTRFARALAQL